MKKAVLIVIAIAILGAIGLAVQKKPGSTVSLGQLKPTNNVASSTGSTPTSSDNSSSSTTNTSATYKDGTYDGSTGTPYGTVQIAVVISSGKITDVKFLQMPSDQFHSQEVTAYAEPYLKQTTLQHQNSQIDFVSGATSTSAGYQMSLQQALDQAAQS